MIPLTINTAGSNPDVSTAFVRGLHRFKNTALVAIMGLALMGIAPNALAEDKDKEKKAEEEKALSVTIKRLSLEAAQRVAQATIDECRKQGYQVSVTVVDRAGVPQVMLRDTLAPTISVSISKDKAYTATNFTAPSGGLARLKDSPLYNRDGLAMMAGAVLIEAGGTVYGAVGVSGAPGGDIDESCAKAGAAAIAEDLEMAD